MTISTEEFARLRVPLASLPGFDPVGLRINAGSYGKGLCTGASPIIAAWRFLCDDGSAGGADGGALRVDLADASTADRVARWVAGRVDFEVGCTAPDWHHGTDHDGNGGWLLFWFDDGDSAEYYFGYPELEGLDWEDPRRLPDGSRYVDRLALALVAVHLGGQR